MATHQQSLLDQLHDIYQLSHTPFWQTRWFFMVIAAFMVLLALVLLWYTYKKWRNRRHKQEPWERALSQMELLCNEGMVHADQAKLFYSTLTRIIKEYMQDRWNTPLVSKTDDEILAYSDSIDVADQVRRGVREIFDGVIFIKFAQAEVALERMKRDVAAGKAFVQATIPKKNKSH